MTHGSVRRAGFLGKEYHWLEGGVLLRVTGELTPHQARDYRTALKQVAEQN